VRLWKITSSPPPKYDNTIITHGTAFINAVTYLPPSQDYPEGLIVSGGKDTIIEVRQPGKAPDETAEALLIGHAHNVCILDSDPEGRYIVSGSWDGQGRVWHVGKWTCESVLDGHEGSVWGVLAYNAETIITACADKKIRIFHTSGKLIKTIQGGADVVRALCRIPQGHPSGADFASAGNDGIIRLWTLSGKQVGELRGHESFIYSLASSSNGEIFSSGEDRTVRIWKGQDCVQTITHPAISVWDVAVCAENGDIVTGASDRIVRVFTRNAERTADAETIRLFDESVRSSSIPQQQLGEVNKEKLPGSEFLTTKAGTKEGQVQMIREGDGSITAHQWSAGT
jgi:phospholipase A-2-activating protein